MAITLDGLPVRCVAIDLGIHTDTIRLYKRELNKELNASDFSWIGYNKIISTDDIELIKKYHFLIKIVGKKQAIKLIKEELS